MICYEVRHQMKDHAESKESWKEFSSFSWLWRVADSLWKLLLHATILVMVLDAILMLTFSMIQSGLWFPRHHWVLDQFPIPIQLPHLSIPNMIVPGLWVHVYCWSNRFSWLVSVARQQSVIWHLTWLLCFDSTVAATKKHIFYITVLYLMDKWIIKYESCFIFHVLYTTTDTYMKNHSTTIICVVTFMVVTIS